MGVDKIKDRWRFGVLLAVSIIIHLLALIFYVWRTQHSENEVEETSVVQIKLIKHHLEEPGPEPEPEPGPEPEPKRQRSFILSTPKTKIPNA
ncbi:hypothetical protein A3755_19930 [Oleiphilus sp. HI0085]|nr:hypothetical protein A3755_19930 [Oleiphilus sp. HI0085]